MNAEEAHLESLFQQMEDVSTISHYSSALLFVVFSQSLEDAKKVARMALWGEDA